jgi:hypothetical protein
MGRAPRGRKIRNSRLYTVVSAPLTGPVLASVRILPGSRRETNRLRRPHWRWPILDPC